MINSTMRGRRTPRWVLGLVLAISFGATAEDAAAAPFLDFMSTSGSTFVGDWASETGTLLIDNAFVIALKFEDGTLQHMFFPWFGDAALTDAAGGAELNITAKFIGGSLDPLAPNTLEIFNGTTFFEAAITSGSFETGIAVSFSSLVSTGPGTVDNTLSDWFIENFDKLSTSGALVFNFDGIADGPVGVGSAGVTELENITGKLIPVPEPTSLALVGVAVVGAAVRHRRRKAAVAA